MKNRPDHRSAQAAESVRQRYGSIDSLRVAMMCVVMLGHPLLPYTTVPRRFQDPAAHVAFDVLGVFLYGFAMPAFFVTAGFAAGGLYARRGVRKFWLNRLQRIFLPLLVGYVLLTPLTRAAYEFAQAAAASGQWQMGWAVLCEAHWLRWGKAYHLWFLVSLLVFSALTVAILGLLRRLSPRWLQLLRDAARQVLKGRLRLPLLSAWIAAFMVPSYVFGTGQGSDIWMQLAVFNFFALGWLLYHNVDALTDFVERWWCGLALGLAVMPLCAWATLQRLHAGGHFDPLIGTLAGIANAVLAVSMTLALIGLFQRYLARQGLLARYLSDASYWVYLIHYPIVVAAGGLLSTNTWPVLLKYLAVLGIAIPIILGSYELLVRRTPMARVLGGAMRN